MSRDVSKSRTHSPIDHSVQKILNLNSSPGSSRKHSEKGKDEGVHIPIFSKEISLDSDEDITKVLNIEISQSDSHNSESLSTPVQKSKNISPKGILKRRLPEPQCIGVTEVREKTKCCHPLVNKLKHLADKTMHKLDKSDHEKSPITKRKKNEEIQEIKQLKNSPGALRRKKFSAIKLGDSDEMSKTVAIDTPPPKTKKEHVYEDIEETPDIQKSQQFSLNTNISKNIHYKDHNSEVESKSIASQDPSLVGDDNTSLKPNEYIMETLHNNNVNKEAILLDEEMDSEDTNIEEIFQNQKDDTRHNNDSPNITITEIIDDDNSIDHSTTIPIETSPTPSPINIERKRTDVDKDWSRPNSDHEYEIIDKPPPNIIYTSPSIDEKPTMVKTDDELSSTTSIERKYLQNISDEEEQIVERGHFDTKKSEELISAELLQKDIEDRFFVNTPSTASRTECEISTSQVDSSALESLPLKRSSRNKNSESSENKIQQRIKEGTGKLKSQAGKLKTKLHNLKNKQFSLPDRSKINFPDRSIFKIPERTKISFPERPKFTLPDRRKFSLPERPKFKSINFTGKLSMKDRKKFSFPERPKFNVPDLPKFKIPDRPKINFPSIGRKKQIKIESNKSESTSDLQNVASVDFEVKTYPRLFGRKKKSQMEKTSSSPTLNREETPPPTFTFTRVRDKKHSEPSAYIPDSPEEPREYGTIDREANYNKDVDGQDFSTTYDFDKLEQEYANEDEIEPNHNNLSPTATSSKQNYTHINEINNDEFFVRPRGISHENIQVREYLSDEIRQAFNIPKNILADMGSGTIINSENVYANDEDVDPELIIEDKQHTTYSTEDINERDDGYYTFPPVRPSRAKRKNKDCESLKFIDDSMNASMQFSEVDLRLSGDPLTNIDKHDIEDIDYSDNDFHKSAHDMRPSTDLHSIHEYANDDIIEYPDSIPIQSQTLPMPPKRKKKMLLKSITKHSSLSDDNDFIANETWQAPQEQVEDIIVYRTQHEYIVPVQETVMTENSPLPPRRTRSRSSRTTSLCDDDRTSHGAESLILDAQIAPTNETYVEIENNVRHESPGYATVDKGQYLPSKISRRSKSKTPPIRTRKSNSSERKYYTVTGSKAMPNRPPRKKSSTSLMTLNSYTKTSIDGDTTQYVEIDEPFNEEVHKVLQSGEVVKKMKDRPLPPPPRPPRGPKRKKDCDQSLTHISNVHIESFEEGIHIQSFGSQEVVEIEVSTQTDPLPDDIDFELGMDENFDISMSSSLRDIIDEEPILAKIHEKSTELRSSSRTKSKSEKSLRLSDPKISSIGRSSPTVILVEKRVSSPTRINEREEILTEASLTVQHIDIDDSQVPNVPPLPKTKTSGTSAKDIVAQDNQLTLEISGDIKKDAQLDSLTTQRLQVKDLEVGRLNVSELQATKILVSDIEGMTLNVNELDSKSGHISVSGIDFSQTVIDEIVKKFAEISTNIITPSFHASESGEHVRPVSREEETQTEICQSAIKTEASTVSENILQTAPPPPSPSSTQRENIEETSPPQRPPPPDLTPLLFSYLQDITTTTTPQPRSFRDRYFTELEGQHPTPPPPRRAKRKPAVLHSESSSDDGKLRPSPRRMPPIKAQEPSITEAGAQFLRVCQTSISRTFRNIFNLFMSYINGTEDKRDVQMAMVIFIVLIAGLIMFGLHDSRTIHHHHWEFFNPPNGKQ